MKRLLVRVKPVDGECYGGYVERLAKENGFEHSKWFCQEFCGVSHCQSYFVPVDSIAQIAELNEEHKQRLWLQNDHMTGFTFRGARMPRILISLGRRFCAQCLASGGYRIAVWNMGLAPVCLKHGTLLSEGCSKCSSKMGLFHDVQCGCVTKALARQIPVSQEVQDYVQGLVNEVVSGDGETWRVRQTKILTVAYLQLKPNVYGRNYPNVTRLPKLDRYPLTPSQTVSYYSKLLGQQAP